MIRITKRAIDHPNISGDSYMIEIGNWLRRRWCSFFHRSHWEYMTWGGDGFHHMNHCNLCGEDWPERGSEYIDQQGYLVMPINGQKRLTEHSDV